MKYILLCSLFLFIACNPKSEKDSIAEKEETTSSNLEIESESKEENTAPKMYTNARFKDVTVEKSGKDSFLIKGQAQIFEANLSWVVEDGHNELKKGFATATAGAPEWGNFEFNIEVEKTNEHATLMLILYESSAKDGSRQHELPIVLE
jgi:hypothetical protein